MMHSFKDKVGIVTGGSDGIGRATSRMLAARGATVIVCARRKEKLEETRREIEAEGGKVEIVALDVTEFDALRETITSVAQRHGRLDFLVNNAMSTHYAPIGKLTLEHWRKDFAVNADAVFVGTKAAMEIMGEQGGGAIVNVSSSCGVRAATNMASYSASKAALTHFTACAAMEGARRNIRINAIVPGQVQTAGTEGFAAKAPKVAEQTVDAIPMGRGGEPDELAEVICFMLSDAAAYITGTALPVDGGKAAQLYMPYAYNG